MKNSYKVFLRRFKAEPYNKFLRPSFLLAVFFLVVMNALVYFGNPRIGAFDIHWIPEMCLTYFIGVWASEVNLFSFKGLIGFYLGSTVLTTWLLYGGSFYVFVMGLILNFPVVIGFVVEEIYSFQEAIKEIRPLFRLAWREA